MVAYSSHLFYREVSDKKTETELKIINQYSALH